MALGSEVNDNMPQNGTNEIKSNKSGNKSSETSAGDHLKKAKKQQKTVTQKLPAGVGGGGGGKSRMKGDAIINGHPKEKVGEGHKNGDSNGEAPPTKQNGHHLDANNTHSKEGTGASIGGKQTSTTPIGGQPTNCVTPSYAAAAAKSVASRINSPESSLTVSSPEVAADSAAPNSSTDACKLNSKASPSTYDKTESNQCPKPATNKSLEACQKTNFQKIPEKNSPIPEIITDSVEVCQKKVEVCKRSITEGITPTACEKTDKKSDNDTSTKVVIKSNGSNIKVVNRNPPGDTNNTPVTKIVAEDKVNKTVTKSPSAEKINKAVTKVVKNDSKSLDTKSTLVDKDSKSVNQTTSDEVCTKPVGRNSKDESTDKPVSKTAAKIAANEASKVTEIASKLSNEAIAIKTTEICSKPLSEASKSLEEDIDSGIASCGETMSDPSSDTSGAAGEATGDEEGDDKKGDQEVLFIQDVGFTVKIVSPGAQPFDIQVSSMELVQEIHQLLMDREDTCHRTCFSLQLDGNNLDNFAEVKNIEGLKEGSVIKVVEEPYTVREARIHVRHVRDLLKSLDSSDAYTGTECNSLAFLNVVTQGDILEKKKTRPESVDCTPPDYIMPGSKERPLLPLHPITKESKGPQCIKILTTSGWNPPPGPRKMNGDLLYLHVVTMEDRHFHVTACSRGFYLNQCTEEVFTPKAANPWHLSHSLMDLLSSISPAFKRSFGAVQRRRTQKHPFERVATPYQVYSWAAPNIEHTVDAIRAEDNFSSKLGYEEHIPGQTRDWNEELQTTRELPRKNLPERLLRERAIFKVHSDFVAAATRGAMAVVDGNVMAINPGEEAKMQMFIWNNIFFSLGFDVRDHYKELGGDAAAFVAPRNDLQGVRVYSAVDLEGLYTLGTVVIDYRGFRVTAQSIIPGILEKEQEQSVIYGSIDFGKTVLTHPKYMELLSKAGKQLKILPHSVLSAKGESVELCSSVECKGIVGNDGRHYILDLLRTFPPDVNFLKLDGVELSSQVKAFGFPIEHKHKLCCLRQELVDSFVEARYLMFIRYTAFHFQQLGIKKQKDKESSSAHTNKAIEYSSDNSNVEKSIIDKLEEVVKETQEKKETKVKVEIKEKPSKSDKKNKKEQLKKGAEEVKFEAEKSQIKEVKSEEEIIVGQEKKDEGQEKLEDPNEIDLIIPPANENEVDSDEGKKIVESIIDSISNGDKQEMAESTRDIVRAAAKSVGSLKEAEFDIRFNPDVFSDGIQHACSAEELDKQKKLVTEAAAFLVTSQIPTFVRECMDHSSAPMDGSTLADALHTRGINMRYLGRVCDLLAQVKPLSYLHTIAVSEIILRATKHIFTAYVQACELMSLSQAVSHFLNCLLGSVPSPLCALPEEARSAPRRKARRRTTRYTILTPKSLWAQIRQELKSYWGWALPTDSIDVTVEKYGFQKISLLRSFCIKVGLQLLLREYDFDGKHKVTFNSSDIMNIFPVVKHINPRASDAYNFYTTGQSKIQAGQVRDGHELITEALNLLNNVYGAMHPEIAQCLRMVARLCYVTGEHREAMAYQQKAVLMSERVNGIDHPYTITEYTHLALYCFANGQVSSALKLLYRARYLALLVCGENHPEIALLDSNISLILHAVGEYELSLRFLERASALTAACHGARSLKAAAARHLLARTLSCLGDFRAALQHERETYSIYKQQLGESHEKTRESSDCLRHLTHQAVVLQKKMNDICSGRAAGAPPIHIQPPSMGSVLDMLNVINGILFVQISQQDIEHFKAEMEKRQLKESSSESPPEEGGSPAGQEQGQEISSSS